MTAFRRRRGEGSIDVHDHDHVSASLEGDVQGFPCRLGDDEGSRRVHVVGVVGGRAARRRLPVFVETPDYQHTARRRDPEIAPARVRCDAALCGEIRRVFDENFQVYGVRKVWRQLQREGETVARCTVARLMRDMGLQGAVRGKRIKTTFSDKSADYPLDKVRRQFQAPRPNALWVSDFTYVATWAGFVYVAFVIDTFARRIVGWRVSRTAHASFVLDALEQALHDRRPVHGGGLVHHSDRGVQYVSIKYTERLVAAVIAFDGEF
jgi:putative transposase